MFDRLRYDLRCSAEFRATLCPVLDLGAMKLVALPHRIEQLEQQTGATFDPDLSAELDRLQADLEEIIEGLWKYGGVMA